MFELTRNSTVPLVEQITERIAALVQQGQLAPGARLPSIRHLARLLPASPFTVVDAYDRLVARNLIESRAGRGFFVCHRKVPTPLLGLESLADPRIGSTAGADVASLADPGVDVASLADGGADAVSLADPGADAVSLARIALASSSDLIAAGSGFLPENWLLEATPASVLNRLSKGHRPQAWLPCPAQGLTYLRERIAARLAQRGIAANVANIATTYGASQAFDLLARILLSPGDTVLVEDPGYFVLFEQLRAHHVRLIPIPRGAGGPDVDALEAACRAHRPRAFFTQTLLHNPTGSNSEPATCHRVLSLAEQFGFALIEDDVYGDLHQGTAVRLAQIDGLRHVIYVGSFTKLIGPALRVGFVAADPALIGRLVEKKVLATLSGSALLEAFVAEVLDSGRYRKHVEAVRTRLVRMRRAALDSLQSAGVHFEQPAHEGLFLWGRVPDAAPVDALVRKARQHSILLARGTLFSPAGGCGQCLRFNVAHSVSAPLVRFLSQELRAAA